jgi:hypothetical protein
MREIIKIIMKIIKKIIEKVICDVRVLISLLVIGISFYGIMNIACHVYWGSGDKESYESAKYVFNALFPVLSTWIGTVIAFYFSRENFEAANKSMQEIVSKLSPMEKLKSIPVKDKMIKFDEIVKYQLEKGEVLDNCRLSKIREKFSTFNRLIIIGKAKQAIYVIHKSIIDRLYTDYLLKSKDTNELTIKNLCEDSEICKILKNSFAVVKEDATLADAKVKMDSVKDALDVIVTKSGDKSEPVIGWITNVIIEENSKV